MQATIEDLGSKNGTHVNRERIEHPVLLKDGDRIQLGSMAVTYRITDPLPSTLSAG